MSGRRTRMALLTARAQLGLARQGQSLLEHKRDALLREIHDGIRHLDADRQRLDDAAAEAARALSDARTWHGEEPIAAAAAAAAPVVAAELVQAPVLGVAVPVVSAPDPRRRAGERGRDPLSDGIAVEVAADRFEAELAAVMQVASSEARVRSLARDARQTSRRVNALRFRVVPALEVEVRTLAFALEQRERDDQFRLKLMKSRRTTAPRA